MVKSRFDIKIADKDKFLTMMPNSITHCSTASFTVYLRTLLKSVLRVYALQHHHR
jgi:hypothetical protein